MRTTRWLRSDSQARACQVRHDLDIALSTRVRTESRSVCVGSSSSSGGGSVARRSHDRLLAALKDERGRENAHREVDTVRRRCQVGAEVDSIAQRSRQRLVVVLLADRDRIEIDWEYPVAQQRALQSEHIPARNLVATRSEVREAALSPSSWW